MSSVGYVLAQIAAVSVFLAFASWMYRSAKKEEREFQAWAEDSGYSFQAQRKWNPREYGLRPLDVGPRRKVTWFVSSGLYEAFQCQTNIKESHGSHEVYTVAVKKISNPGSFMSIEREDIRHKALSSLGGEDIGFESDAFSRLFWVQCKDRKHAYDVIHPEMMDYLMDHMMPHVQWGDRALLVKIQGPLTSQNVPQLWNFLEGFVARVPARLFAKQT